MWKIVALRFKGIEKIKNVFGKQVIDFDECGGYECLVADKTAAVADNLGWLNQGLKHITGLDECFTLEQRQAERFRSAWF